MVFIDGKNEGWEDLEGKSNFYAGENSIEGIRYFYNNIFQYKHKNKQDKEFRNKTHLLCIDEYSAILQDLSKAEQEEVKMMVSRISKMREKFRLFYMDRFTDSI